MTAGAVDLGEKPSVISAIAKYHMTERVRKVVDDAMDIHGGKGICLGPNNWVGRGYQVIPVGITVEGANILTRSLIIFGQGAIRCHPYVLREMHAAKDPDHARASVEFDDAFTSHIGHTIANGVRAFVHGLTGAIFAPKPAGAAPETARYYQRTAQLSAAFALLADVSMLAMGGELKRREKISARLGDVLSMMYLISATLKRYEDQGRMREDLPLLHWSVRDALWQAQQAIDAIYTNFPVPALRALLRWVVFPLGTPFRPPKDRHNHRCAKLVLEPGAARDRLTAGMYLPKGEEDATGVLEAAFTATVACEPIEKKLREAVKSGAAGAALGPGYRHAGARQGRDHGRGARAVAAQGAAAQGSDQGGRFPAGFRPRRDHAAPGAGKTGRQGGLTGEQHVGSASQACLRRRRRAHAVPQGEEPPGPVFRRRPRHAGRAHAADAPAVLAHRTRRSDPRLRFALAR